MTQLVDQIAQILAVETSPDWQVLDSDEDVHLIHYTDSADMNKFGHLRGVVVDVQEKRIVCDSYGYTPMVVSNSLDVQEVIDLDGNTHDLTTATFQRGYEGTTVRVFTVRGKIYHSTHRRLDCSRSRWGNSPTFFKMYQDLGGPADELLGEDTHIFLVIHPAVLIATKEFIDKGYVVRLKGPAQEALEKFSPLDYTREQAQTHLTQGFATKVHEQADSRLNTGEFVIAHVGGKTIKIASTAYAWRLGMRGNDPNLRHRMYSLITSARLDRDTYKSQYPIVTPYEELDSVVENPIVNFPQETPSDKWIETPLDRLYNTWLCFLMAVPLHLQKQVLPYYEQIIKERRQLFNYLKNRTDTDSELSHRAQTIIRVADRKSPYFERNLRNLINKENGDSFYRLVRDMNAV